MITAYQRHEVQWRSQTQQNAARLAHAYAFYNSRGWGEFVLDDVFEFNLTFIHQPAVSHGYSLTDDDDELIPKRFPRAWGGIHGWRRTPKGFYTGAYVFLIVDTRSAASVSGMPATEPNYALTHYFTFSGIAVKDLDEDLFDE